MYLLASAVRASTAAYALGISTGAGQGPGLPENYQLCQTAPPPPSPSGRPAPRALLRMADPSKSPSPAGGPAPLPGPLCLCKPVKENACSYLSGMIPDMQKLSNIKLN